MDIEKVKKYLRITWDSEDVYLQDILDRGKNFLNGKAGVPIDYESDHEAQQLLLDYCRYVYNHAFEMFEHNFQMQINSLIFTKGAEDHAESDQETES